MEAAQFMRGVIVALPTRVHTVVVVNGIQFTDRAPDAHAFALIFFRVFRENGFEHRLTKVRRP